MKVKIDRLLAISQARAAIADGRLRGLREALGLSQRELASALGVDETAVSRWEAGLRVPRAEVAERLYVLLRALEEGSPERAKPAVAGSKASPERSDGL